MPLQVCLGATMKCTMGLAPSKLIVTPMNKVFTGMVPDANINDHIPITNIAPFGNCKSPTFPATAAATTAAQGVLTPMPCVPLTPAPWTPGSPTILLGNFPTLDDTSMLVCSWGGQITFVDAGETTVNVD